MSDEYNCPPVCPKCHRCHRGDCQPNEQSSLAAMTGLASEAGQLRERPQNFYRLVMQLEATPKNSELIHAALAALAKLQPSPEGMAAVIKLETVNMSHYLRPRTPNDGAMPRRQTK